MTPPRPDLSIVVLFYDEEPNVAPAISDIDESLSREGVDYQIVAVNNGSSDRTGEILEELRSANPRITVCTVIPNQGYGWGVISGLQQARGQILGYMWGDCQVEARWLVEIYRHLRETPEQLCKARRLGRSAYRPFRRVQSWTYNALFRAAFGVDSDDVNGCPKLMRREAYEALRLSSHDWFIDAELMIKARRLGFSCGEVAVPFTQRQRGRSHVSLLTTLEFAENMTKARLGLLPWD